MSTYPVSLRGPICEKLVLGIYLKQGWRCLYKNQKIMGVEVDLVVVKGAHCRILEVKALSCWENLSFRLSPRQAARLCRARQHLESRMHKAYVDLYVAYICGRHWLEMAIEDHGRLGD